MKKRAGRTTITSNIKSEKPTIIKTNITTGYKICSERGKILRIRPKIRTRDTKNFQRYNLQRRCRRNGYEPVYNSIKKRFGEVSVSFTEAMQTACRAAFKIINTKCKTKEKKSVPWWTDSLTIMRKRINALRRLHKRTRNNEELRKSRKHRYLEEK